MSPLVPWATPPPDLLAPRTLTVMGMSRLCAASATHIGLGMVQMGLSVYTTRSFAWLATCRRISNRSCPWGALTLNRGRNQLFGNSAPMPGSSKQGPPVALPLPAGPKMVAELGGAPASEIG